MITAYEVKQIVGKLFPRNLYSDEELMKDIFCIIIQISNPKQEV